VAGVPTTLVGTQHAPRADPRRNLSAGEKGLGKGTGCGSCPENGMRPAVAVYNSPVLPSEPSSRRPVQPLRVRPSSPAEPVALRQPTPQPFRARPRSLAASEWRPCGLLAGDPLESFPSPTGFLTGRERSVEIRPSNPQSGTSVQEQAFDPGGAGTPVTKVMPARPPGHIP